jgi:TetR/AcrR family transcriptional regulator, tetracycline repressor protein
VPLVGRLDDAVEGQIVDAALALLDADGLDQLSMRQVARSLDTTAATAAATARDYLAALPGERFPNLVALAGHFADADADQQFELLLDIFVAGLAQRASP